MSERVLIVGVSTRALAESAVRAGYACTTIDYFGDIDQKAMVANVALGPDLGKACSGQALVAAAEGVRASSVVYGANLENYPDAVARLAVGRELLGNGPTALRRVRDFRTLASVLVSAGIMVPATLGRDSAHTADPELDWVRKPMRSGGGLGVVRWQPGEPLRSDEVVQQFLPGRPASAVVVADGQRASVLGLTRQIVGSKACGSWGFRYCGSILPLTQDAGEFESVVSQVRRAAEVAAVAFALRGVFGVDFVVGDGGIYVLEVNPRYTASMELVERAYGISIFDAHVRACRGSAPIFDLSDRCGAGTAYGKAILFARRPVTLGDTRSWQRNGFRARDVPRPGTKIASGAPIITLFADAQSPRACQRLLNRCARLQWASIVRRRATRGGGPVSRAK